MRFLRRIKEVTLFNKVHSSEIRKSLNIKPLLLRIERSQLRWFGHVSRMPQERLPKQALHVKANGRRPVGRPRTRWTDYVEDLGWNRLGLRPSEMMEVMEDREVCWLNLELLPPQPLRKSGQWRKKKKKISVSSSLLITKFESYIQLPGIYDKFFIILKFEITNANAFHDTNKTNSDQSTFLHEVWQWRWWNFSTWFCHKYWLLHHNRLNHE